MNSQGVNALETRAPRNRTLTLSDDDSKRLRPRLITGLDSPPTMEQCLDKTFVGDALKIVQLLPRHAFDLIIVDPPYNMTKSFSGTTFDKRASSEYETWLRSWLSPLRSLLKETASLYVCSEWRTSPIVHRVLEELFIVQNRITWEREKGRGALRNWKNCSEDIWFCTVSDNYYFNVEAVKVKRKVIAPYRHSDGKPKDWESKVDGDFRNTHPSNLWTDITVPFWSMPENTDHPTQKPEKLIAKLMLASSQQGDIILDPFLGSGTTSVVAKKLGRRYVGVELAEAYGLIAERRIELAEQDKSIQGYRDGIFWERNSLAQQPGNKNSLSSGSDSNERGPLFAFDAQK